MKLTTLALLFLLLCNVGICQTNAPKTNTTISPDSIILPLAQKPDALIKTNAIRQSQPDQKPNAESLISVILNSNLVAAIIGLASALFVFYLTEQSQRRKHAEENRRKYLVLLNSTRNELGFYADKLTTLSEKIVSAISDVEQSRGGVILPSFSLYPSFLEQSKIELNSLFQNASIVQEIGHCHFELCHILERLNWLKGEQFKEMLNQPQYRKISLANLASIQSLVGTSISAFHKTAAKLDDEIITVSKLI